MRTAPAAFMTLVLATGAASADVERITGLEVKSAPAEAALGGTLHESLIDLSGHAHFDVLGSEQNNVLHADFGGEALRVTGLSWDLGARTYSNLPLSELRVAVFNEGGEGVVFTPFAGFDSPGAGRIASAFYDLEALGLDFALGGEGAYVELFFDREYAATSEGVYDEASFITLGLSPIPSPGALGVLGAGALMAARRRRR